MLNINLSHQANNPLVRDFIFLEMAIQNHWPVKVSPQQAYSITTPIHGNQVYQGVANYRPWSLSMMHCGIDSR